MWQNTCMFVGAWLFGASALIAHAPESSGSLSHEVLHLWTGLHHGAPLVWLAMGLAALGFLSFKPLTKK